MWICLSVFHCDGEMTSETALLWSTIYHNKNNNYWKKPAAFAYNRKRPRAMKEKAKDFIRAHLDFSWIPLDSFLFSIFVCLLAPPPSQLYTVHVEMPRAQTPISCHISIFLSEVHGACRKENAISFLIGSDWQQGCISLRRPSTHTDNVHAPRALSSLRLTVKGDIKMRRWWIYWRSALSPILFPSLLTEHGTGW